MWKVRECVENCEIKICRKISLEKTKKGERKTRKIFSNKIFLKIDKMWTENRKCGVGECLTVDLCKTFIWSVVCLPFANFLIRESKAISDLLNKFVRFMLPFMIHPQWDCVGGELYVNKEKEMTVQRWFFSAAAQDVWIDKQR